MAVTLDWLKIDAAKYGEEDKNFTLGNSEVKFLLSVANQYIAWQNAPSQEETDSFIETLTAKLLTRDSMSHTHDYADPAHTHNYAAAAHTHNYADPAHTHNYADPAHTHNYANPAHTHNYADPAHTHTDYAAAAHTHPTTRMVGEMTLWPTDTAPSGWLLCAGQAVSRSTYAGLFTVIGTTYGTGNGSTTFHLPDMRGRVPLGQDDMGGSSANRVTAAAADVMGGTGGAETHTLTINEMPSHRHEMFAYSVAGWWNPARAGNGGSGDASQAWTQYTGGGQPHNNIPPYLTVNYIIYTGV